MTVRIDGPITAPEALDALRELYAELHAEHLNVATFDRLVRDVDVSWRRRSALYRAALEGGGGAYFVAADDRERRLGYAFTVTTAQPDDTFDTTGTIEVVTLVVAADHRGRGVGRNLLQAAQTEAERSGIDTIKLSVLQGNGNALAFYTALGYEPAETVLYRRVDQQ